MIKKSMSFILGAVMLLALATACGSEDEPTAAPAATVAVAEETATEAPEPTTEAAEETEAPTEEPVEEDPKEEPVQFDVMEIQELFESCTGISGTAGSSLKWALAAEKCLKYSVENQLSGLNDESFDSFKQSMQAAYEELSKKEQRSLKTEMRENIMPIISDSFQEPELYEGDMEDAGVLKAWKRVMAEPYVKDDWSSFWEAFETVVG